MRSIFVECREWFDRTYGNSYYSARVYMDGEHIFTTGLTYGYDFAYEDEVARELVRRNLPPEGMRDKSIRWAKDYGFHVYTVKYPAGKRELWAQA